MDERTSPWHGRRVLVTGCADPLGAAVVRELLACRSEVVGLVRDRVAAVRIPTPVQIIYGRPEDRFRVYSALAVHEIETVFHFDANQPNTVDHSTATVIEAARLRDPRIPVILARLVGNTVTPAASPVPLGIVTLVQRGPGDVVANDLSEAACDCLRLAEQLAARPEPRVEVATIVAGWNLGSHPIGSPDRRAA